MLGALLNDYFGGMTEIVFAHGGTVAKIIGDALHVLFGAPATSPTTPRAPSLARSASTPSARRSARDGAQRGRRRSARRASALHAGAALVGNFGGGRFFDYTAYGDTINVAARLEAANKALGTRICASARGRRSAPPGVAVRPIGNLMLRGRQEKLACFEPVADDAASLRDIASAT